MANSDFSQIIKELPGDTDKIIGALKILAECGIFTAMSRKNMNRLVDGRVDSDVGDVELAQEIREVRQTNRVLLSLEESAHQITKGM